MLKIVLGFVVFAALSLFVIFKAVPEDSKPVAAPASAADTPTAPAAPAAAPAPAGK
jgi:hypothetical protein